MCKKQRMLSKKRKWNQIGTERSKAKITETGRDEEISSGP